MDRVVEAHGLQVGGHQRVRRLARYPAGKAVNMARAATALGAATVVTGFVGDEEAAWYQQFLLEQGVEVCRLIAVRGSTRENITIVDPGLPGVDTHLVEEGFVVSADEVARLRDALHGLANSTSLVAFCGSLPPGLEIEAYVALVRQCLDRGAMVAIDTSGAALKAAAELPVWLIKPNRQELAELTGLPVQNALDQQAAAASLSAQICWVLVSAGGEGAWLLNRESSRHAHLPTPVEEIVGTVGCGDVLLGGFLASWQAESAGREDVPGTALRRAVTAATCAATQLARSVDGQAVRVREADVEYSEKAID